MKLKEVFERAGVVSDDKARRMVNVSASIASITATEIERGVTLERIETIGVPVFRYATQITIHGRLPDFSEESRQAGYKAVFRNDCGTIGVRYVAIDADKKTTIVEAARLISGRQWGVTLNSQGLSIARHFEDREACVAAFRAFPRELFCGSVEAGAGVFGGFWVVAYVGAIPASNLWPFIGTLYGIHSAEQFEAMARERAAANLKETEARRVAHAAQMAQLEEKKRAFLASVTRPRLTTPPAGPGSFLRVVTAAGGPALKLYTLAKRGPVLCYSIQDWPKTEDRLPVKFRKVEKFQLEKLREDAAKGFLFVAN